MVILVKKKKLDESTHLILVELQFSRADMKNSLSIYIKTVSPGTSNLLIFSK